MTLRLGVQGTPWELNYRRSLDVVPGHRMSRFSDRKIRVLGAPIRCPNVLCAMG